MAGLGWMQWLRVTWTERLRVSRLVSGQTIVLIEYHSANSICRCQEPLCHHSGFGEC